jgi:hypothetical protein
VFIRFFQRVSYFVFWPPFSFSFFFWCVLFLGRWDEIRDIKNVASCEKIEQNSFVTHGTFSALGSIRSFVTSICFGFFLRQVRDSTLVPDASLTGSAILSNSCCCRERREPSENKVSLGTRCRHRNRSHHDDAVFSMSLNFLSTTVLNGQAVLPELPFSPFPLRASSSETSSLLWSYIFLQQRYISRIVGVHLSWL